MAEQKQREEITIFGGFIPCQLGLQVGFTWISTSASSEALFFPQS